MEYVEAVLQRQLLDYSSRAHSITYMSFLVLGAAPSVAVVLLADDVGSFFFVLNRLNIAQTVYNLCLSRDSHSLLS